MNSVSDNLKLECIIQFSRILKSVKTQKSFIHLDNRLCEITIYTFAAMQTVKFDIILLMETTEYEVNQTKIIEWN